MRHKKILLPTADADPTPPHDPGLLFTHWIADSLTLWKPPVTDERLWMSARYYFVIAKTPIGFLYFFAFVAIGGGFTILWCLREGEAGNLMFDGGSICSYPRIFVPLFPVLTPCRLVLYASAVAVYMHTVLPSKPPTATLPLRHGLTVDVLVCNPSFQTSKRTSYPYPSLLQRFQKL